MKFIIETDDASNLGAIVEDIQSYMTCDNYQDETRTQYSSGSVIVHHRKNGDLAVYLSTNKNRTIKVFASKHA